MDVFTMYLFPPLVSHVGFHPDERMRSMKLLLRVRTAGETEQELHSTTQAMCESK